MNTISISIDAAHFTSPYEGQKPQTGSGCILLQDKPGNDLYIHGTAEEIAGFADRILEIVRPTATENPPLVPLADQDRSGEETLRDVEFNLDYVYPVEKALTAVDDDGTPF